jgi:hypothetical protein
LKLIKYVFILTCLGMSFAAQAEGEYRRSISLGWEPTPDAQSYEIVIEQEGKKSPTTFLVTDSEWTGTLAMGHYKFKVRARDARKVPGEWSEYSEFGVGIENVKILSPAAGGKVKSNSEEETKVTLKWEPLPGATEYLWEVKNDKNEVLKSGKTDETSTSVKVPVAAHYSWSVSGVGPQGFKSPAPTLADFTVIGKKLEQPDPKKPVNNFVREIKWEAPKLAKSYDYAILKWDGAQKKWILQEKKSTESKVAPFDPKYKGGLYKLQVRSSAPNRESSSTAELKFDVGSGDRSPAAEEHALIMESVDHSQGYFAVFSYLLTALNYSGNNWDHITDPTSTPSANFNGAIGGTGRAGIGFLSPKSKWGFLGIADYGGISVGSSIINFASLEASMIRRNLVGSAGELRQMFGLFYKQYPDVIPNSDGTFAGTTVSTIGPHYGLEYWYALNRKLGFQVNGHGYLNTLTASTPSGGSVQTSLSYQLGFLGSYRLGPNTTGLMGVAYRTDQVSYPSSLGPTDTISLTGTYFNAVLEWSL